MGKKTIYTGRNGNIFKSLTMKIDVGRHEKWTEKLKKLLRYEINLKYPHVFEEFNGVTYRITDNDVLLSDLYLEFQDGGVISYHHWTDIDEKLVMGYYHKLLNLMIECKVYVDRGPVNHNLIEYVASDKSSDLELGMHVKDVGSCVDNVTYDLATSDFVIRLTDIGRRSAFVVKYIRFTGKGSTRIVRVGLSNIMPKKNEDKPYKLRDNVQFTYLTDYKVKSLIISNVINSIRALE